MYISLSGCSVASASCMRAYAGAASGWLASSADLMATLFLIPLISRYRTSLARCSPRGGPNDPLPAKARSEMPASQLDDLLPLGNIPKRHIDPPHPFGPSRCKYQNTTRCLLRLRAPRLPPTRSRRGPSLPKPTVASAYEIMPHHELICISRDVSRGSTCLASPNPTQFLLRSAHTT